MLASWSSAHAQGSKSAASSPKGNSGPAAIQVPADPHASSASYGDWVLVCQKPVADGRRVCEIAQSIQVQGQPAPIARLAIARGSVERGSVLVLVLPPNVLLTSQPAIISDENDKSGLAIAWKRCLPGGCFAEVSMVDNTLETWRNRAGQGRIAFADAVGRTINVPFSFRGLAQALDALAKERS